ncbi:hypothetical protein B0G77_5000 [Paraburkholderia sp. BL10I2N1]|nr:hypothetical protein B0G77_5000 [Paraburkholderia sp. BL10I2N1]
MDDGWRFQLRLTVSPELSAALREPPASHSHGPLADVLRRHNASLKCQFDAFADYLSEAERQGSEKYAYFKFRVAGLAGQVRASARRSEYLTRVEEVSWDRAGCGRMRQPALQDNVNR